MQDDRSPIDQVFVDAGRPKNLVKDPALVLKFAASRGITSEYAGETATLILELPLLMPTAAEAMTILKKRFASAAMLLMSLRMKPARPQRSPLIQKIKEAVAGDGPDTQDANHVSGSGQLT